MRRALDGAAKMSPVDSGRVRVSAGVGERFLLSSISEGSCGFVIEVLSASQDGSEPSLVEVVFNSDVDSFESDLERFDDGNSLSVSVARLRLDRLVRVDICIEMQFVDAIRQTASRLDAQRMWLTFRANQSRRNQR